MAVEKRRKLFLLLCDQPAAHRSRQGYRGGSPTTVRPSNPALCGSCPL